MTGMRRYIAAMGSWFLAATFLAATPSLAADLGVSSGAPQGFEQMEAPRLTQVNLFYGGDLLGSFKAHFTPTTLQFDQPEQIIAAIPSIADQAAVLDMLRHPLPVHSELLCSARRQNNCGLLTPEIVGVIFDENRLSAEIFLNKDRLAITPAAPDRYLPLPQRHLSSVAGFNGAVSGTGGQSPQFSLGNDSTYSFGEAKLDTQSTVSNQGLRFDTASLGAERQGWAGNGGLFRSRAMQLLSDRDIAGISLNTSSHTLLDSYKAAGNDVLVYLPRRSFVSILREGRLYSSQAYEAGNQHIDTSELPEGAYDITLRIQEADGATREEKRFFVKTQRLPPPDQPAYYVQAGMIRKLAASDATLPQITAKPLLGAGTVQRVSDSIGVSFSGLGLEDRGLMESGVFWMEGGAQIGATALASTRGDLGAEASYLQTTDRLNLAVDVRQLWLTPKPLPGFDDLAQRITQATASIGYALTTDTSLGLRSSYARQSGSLSTTSIGPYAEWRVWQRGESMLGITADAARTLSQYQGSLLLHFTQRFGSWGASSNGGGAFGGGSGGPLGNARIWHDDTTPGNALIAGAGVSGDRKSQTVSGDGDWRNNFGQIRGSAQESFGANGPSFGYGGNFAFNVAALADEVHVGGDQADKSAVIIDTTGNASGRMKVFVNGMERSAVSIGERQVIYLTPFHIYKIRLAPEKNGLLDYDATEHKVTLYPGNVAKLAWVIDRFMVVVASIVAPDGQPLANALLQESRAAVTTDDKGHLQAEVTTATQLHFTPSGTQPACHVALPPQKTVNGVTVYKKPLVCVVAQ